MKGVQELAYEEALRLSDGVANDVEDIRRRAGTLLAVLAISTAFLGGQVLELGSDRLGINLFTLHVLIGCSLFLLVGGLVVRIIWPVRGWVVNLDPKIILEDYARFSPEDRYKKLAIVRCDQYVRNVGKLETLYQVFRLAAILFIAEVIVWLSALTNLIV